MQHNFPPPYFLCIGRDSNWSPSGYQSNYLTSRPRNQLTVNALLYKMQRTVLKIVLVSTDDKDDKAAGQMIFHYCIYCSYLINKQKISIGSTASSIVYSSHTFAGCIHFPVHSEYKQGQNATNLRKNHHLLITYVITTIFIFIYFGSCVASHGVYWVLGGPLLMHIYEIMIRDFNYYSSPVPCRPMLKIEEIEPGEFHYTC